MHSLHKVVAFINKHNKLNLKDEEVKSITKDLIKAGFSEKIKKFQIPTIKNTIEHITKIRNTHNPLRTCTASTQQTCPLCTTTASPTSLTDVLLEGDRRAKYCVEHSVTLPIHKSK